MPCWSLLFPLVCSFLAASPGCQLPPHSSLLNEERKAREGESVGSEAGLGADSPLSDFAQSYLERAHVPPRTSAFGAREPHVKSFEAAWP